MLKKHKNIAGLKDTVPGFPHTRQLINAVRPDFPDFIVLQGYDDNFFHSALSGGNGCIGGLSNLYPEVAAAAAKAFNAGDFAECERLQKKLNITFIYVTHDQEEALTMSDRIAIMHDGIVDQLDSPTEIYEHPATRFVATFIGETNIYDGCVTSIHDGVATVTLENGAVKVKCDDSFSILEYATVSVRPEKMRFQTTPHEGFELVAVVKDYVYVGSVLKCIVALPNGNELKIERLAGQELPPIGSRIFPYWSPEDAVLIHNDSYKIFKILDEIKLA